jgi:hypothetical protein
MVFVLKANDKQKEELAESMQNLGIEGSSSGSPNFKRKPVIIIVVGMAGEDCIYFVFDKKNNILVHVWFLSEFDRIIGSM